MIGAIAGDIIGSVYERTPIKDPAFTPLFARGAQVTDDTVLTVAQMDHLLSGAPWSETLVAWFVRYPNAGYGGTFYRWALAGGGEPYGSYGNGSAMRVSPVGWAFDDEASVLAAAEQSARATHDHPEGIKGAQAVALAVYLARTGASRDTLRATISERFGYDLSRTVAEIRPSYTFDVTCQGSVPQALVAALEADDVEGAIRNAVSLGGDSDTQAAIAGSVAEAMFGVIPQAIVAEVWARLPDPMRVIVRQFYERFRPTFPSYP